MDGLDGGAIGFFIGASIVIIIVGIGMGNVRYDISELAQSICDQKYKMDYDSYDDGVLKCKPKDVKKTINYGGIVVEIGK